MATPSRLHVVRLTACHDVQQENMAIFDRASQTCCPVRDRRNVPARVDYPW